MVHICLVELGSDELPRKPRAIHSLAKHGLTLPGLGARLVRPLAEVVERGRSRHPPHQLDARQLLEQRDRHQVSHGEDEQHRSRREQPQPAVGDRALLAQHLPRAKGG